jgi:hypothetical protein
MGLERAEKLPMTPGARTAGSQVVVQLPPLPLTDLGSAANRCCDCLISYQSVSLPKASKPYEGMTAATMASTRTIFGCGSRSRNTWSLNGFVICAYTRMFLRLRCPK